MASLRMNSAQFLSLRREAVAGVSDADATPIVLSGWKPTVAAQPNFIKFRANGFNADSWSSIVSDSRQFTGDMHLAYDEVDTWLSMWAGDPVSTETISGQIIRTYYVPLNGPRTIVTYSPEWGLRSSCERHVYGLLQAFSIALQRGNQPAISGNATIITTKPTHTGVSMTAGVAQNAIFTITATAATGNASITFAATGTGAGGSVTITPGDSTATVDAAIQALAGYPGVTVTGPGTNAISGSDVLAGATLGTVANVSSPGLLTDGSLATNTSFGWNGGTGATVTYEFAAPTDIDRVRVYTLGHTQAGGASWKVQASAAGDFSDTVDIVGATSFNAFTDNAWVDFDFALDTYLAVRFVAGTAASGDAVVADWQALNSNHAGTNTSSGSYVVEVTSPGNEEIAVATTVSAGWAVTLTQDGGDGLIQTTSTVPVLPQDVTVRHASSISGLDVASPIATAHSAELNVTGLADPHLFVDGTGVTYSNHVDGGQPEYKFTLAVAHDLAGDCATLVGYAEARPSTPRAWELRMVSGSYQISFFFFASVDEAFPQRANGNVYEYQFLLGFLLNSELRYNGLPQGMKVVTREPA